MESPYKDVEELASLPSFTPEKIARFLGIELREFLDLLDSDQQLKSAYQRGVLIAEVEFNKSIVKLSKQGSGPAQTLLHKLKQHAEIQALREYYG